MRKEKLKSQKAAISIFVVVAMLFFLVTIMGLFMITSKRAQTQTESFGMIQDQYYEEGEETEKYFSKIATSSEIIPIYSKEQFWSIGTGTKVEIEGKIYTFSDTAQYQLQNDIILNISIQEDFPIVDASKIDNNNYEIYYFYNDNYYVLATGNTGDLYINGKYFNYKNNLSKNLGYVTDGLVLHYDGIKNSGTEHNSDATTWKDLSGNGNDGKLVGGSWQDNHLTLDGTNYVQAVKNNPVFNGIDGSPDMTVEVISKKTVRSYGDLIAFTHVPDKGRFYMDLWSAREDNRAYEILYYYKDGSFLNQISYTDIPLNTINSISYGKQSTRYFSYVNGMQKDSRNSNESIGWKNNDLYIGRSINDDYGYFFIGEVYSVRIYNRTLTEAEIKQNYEIDKERFNIE